MNTVLVPYTGGSNVATSSDLDIDRPGCSKNARLDALDISHERLVQSLVATAVPGITALI